MLKDHWVLVVEPSDRDRKLIELAAFGVAPGIKLVFIDRYAEFISAISNNGGLPNLAIIDWFADAEGPASCLDTLARFGFLTKLPIIATARDEAIRALTESSGLHIHRFISKQPDDFCFQKKIAEVISLLVPGAKKMMPPAAA